MSYWLRCGLWVPRAVREVFRFFEDPWNLPRITPGWLGFRIVTERIELRAGCLIDYTVRWGIPMKWRTLIEAYEPPCRFVDRQLRGPYRLWRHEHRFVGEARGGVMGTRVEDEVEYVLPLGPVGRAMHWAMIGGNLREIFEYRQRETARLLLGERAPAAKVVRAVEIGRGARPGSLEMP